MKIVHRPHSRAHQSGFSLVEMIGVLAIIAILAVVIVPKVFSTIASSRVTSAIGSTSSMKTAVTDFAGKYGTIPVTNNNSRIDDLLATSGFLDTRFLVKIGTQPTSPALVGATWSNATGTWVATGGVNQTTQSRVICLTSVIAAVPGTTGTNYFLDGVTALPAAARVVSAVIPSVTLNDARDLSQKIDGDAMTQPIGSALADTAGKVAYAAPNAAGTTTVYIYLVHQ
ncbi:MAG TPA: prepilin-type N-terminal cleavage/methylation domain-containing protein [Lacunisphaera sp.]|jgi:prepilin-type N-terminal cleavage/methylation domain-containing protein